MTNLAAVPDMPGNVRMWADELDPETEAIFLQMSDEEYRRRFPRIYGVPHAYLAISGGGANGAFGAGLLAGWTAAGTRPEFTMVTGISTGALTAPFAFLGSAYDERLREVYTTTRTSDLIEERGLFGKLFSESLADTKPLRDLIERTYDAELIEAIAEEHRTGRRLWVGTVNLDAGRPVVWNIGAIAASDAPAKLSLIHDVLLASAAIPVFFPPVMIEVEADGEAYDEMHVDGGTGSQVFAYPVYWDFQELKRRLAVTGTPAVYVIRNSFLEPDFQGVKRTILPIASRSIEALIRTQGIGDLYQIHALCQRDDNDFLLAFIPSSFTEQPAEAFDAEYMTKLFELGLEMAREGYPWKLAPPGLDRKRAARRAAPTSP